MKLIEWCKVLFEPYPIIYAMLDNNLYIMLIVDGCPKADAVAAAIILCEATLSALNRGSCDHTLCSYRML